MTASLCETCKYKREVRTPRSRFLLCEMSLTDADFPKYPPQPVIQCGGYRPTSEATERGQGDPPRRHA
jgi:hypothetical protein